MFDINSETKTVGIAINLQSVFNPLVEAAMLRLPDSQMVNNAIAEFNVSQFEPIKPVNHCLNQQQKYCILTL